MARLLPGLLSLLLAAPAAADDVAAVLDALRDDSATRRRTACEQLTPEALDGAGARRVLERVERLAAADVDPRVRAAAATALGRCGAADARPTLFGLAERDADPEVADLAAQALGRLADTRQVATLLALLADPGVRRRLVAARALAASADPRAPAALRFALTADAHWAVRAAAALGLAEPPDATSLHALVTACVHDRDETVRAACAEALEVATGQRLGRDPEAWRRAHHAGALRPAPPRPDAVPSRDRYADAEPDPHWTVTYWGVTLVPDGTLFCGDVSGSMMSFERLEMARRELRAAVGQMRTTDRFGVLFFNHAQWLWGERFLPANPFTKLALVDALAEVEAKGYTDLLTMFEAAFGVGGAGRLARTPAERLRQLVVLTDGTPSRNYVRDLDLIRRRVREWNPGGRVRVHTIGLGSSDEAFLRALAEENRGTFTAKGE